MKIKFAQLFEPALNLPSKILIFGNDESVIERARRYVMSRFKGAALHGLDESTFLKSDHGAEDVDMFADPGQKDITCVSQIGEKTMKVIKDLPSEDLYVFTSTKVRASSASLKKLETDRGFLAVACYASPLIWGEFLAALTDLPEMYQKPLFRALQHQPDQLHDVARKLDLLGGQMEGVDLGALLPSVHDDSSDRALIEGFLSRDARTFAKSTLAEPIPFLRALNRSLMQLVSLMMALKSGASQKEALQKAGVFFKDEPLYLAALKRWSFGDVMKHIDMTQCLEEQIKFQGATPTQVHHQCLAVI